VSEHNGTPASDDTLMAQVEYDHELHQTTNESLARILFNLSLRIHDWRVAAQVEEASRRLRVWAATPGEIDALDEAASEAIWANRTPEEVAADDALNQRVWERLQGLLAAKLKGGAA